MIQKRCVVTALVLLVLGCLLCWLEYKFSIEFADEGFLWYGCQRVMRGEVPLRDFMAYDPGRYYWASCLMGAIHNDGIFALRFSSFAFAVLGIFAATTIFEKSHSFGWKSLCVLSITLLILCSSIGTHMLDSTISVIMVASVAYLLSAPSRSSFLLAGLTLGLAGVIGRNHALYGAIGQILAFGFLLLARRQFTTRKCLLAWGTGVVIGYLPILYMLAFVPGFATAFWEGITFLLFEVKTTNVSLPVPAPWDAFAQPYPPLFQAHLFLLGLNFWLLPVFDLFGLCFAVARLSQGKPLNPILLSAICLSPGYSHYAYSRADGSHLAISLAPFLIGTLILSGIVARTKSPLQIFLIGSTIICLCLFTLPLRPIGQRLLLKDWAQLDLRGEIVEAPTAIASRDKLLISLVDRYAAKSELFLAEPDMCGLYAVFRSRAPVWELYPFFKRSNQFQQAEIERIKIADPDLIIIHDFALDGNENYRFKNTHDLIFNYIMSHYQQVDIGSSEQGLIAVIKTRN